MAARRSLGEERAAGDTPPPAPPIPTEAEWTAMSQAQRDAWARSYGASRGLTPAEQAAFAEREKTADYRLAIGITRETLSTIRTALSEENQTQQARLRANASIAGSRIAGEREASQAILSAGYGQGPPPGAMGGPMAAPASGGKSGGAAVALGLGALLLLLAK